MYEISYGSLSARLHPLELSDIIEKFVFSVFRLEIVDLEISKPKHRRLSPFQ